MDGNSGRVLPALSVADFHRKRPLAVAFLVCELRNVVYDDTSWHRWLFQLVTRMGLHTSYHAFFHLWERDYLSAVRRGERTYWDALADYLAAAGMSRAQVTEVRAAGIPRRRQAEQHVRVLPGVARTLAQLSGKGIGLAALETNGGDQRSVSRRLAQLHLDGHFHRAVCLPDCDGSPQQRYRTLVDALGWGVDEVGLVGNDAGELMAAAECGLRTISCNVEQPIDSTLQVDHFADLVDLVSPAISRRRAG